MSTKSNLLTIGDLTASEDLSTHRYKFVRVSGAGTVARPTASNQVPVGIVQNNPVSGAAAEVAIVGKSKVVAGAAISAGAEVMSGTDGRALTAATTGNRALGVAVTAAGAANEVIEVLLYPVSRVLP